ncbi:MAG TPA: hypothetical protein VN939_02835 [Chthoniobacterales bacterium]|nr:hypothetical protein [Chthoniobacterales bacterium]
MATTINVLGSTLAFSPDGTRAYVPNSGNYLSVIDTATYEVIAVLKGGLPKAYAIAIAPNGKNAYVVNSLDGTVSVIDISPE